MFHGTDVNNSRHIRRASPPGHTASDAPIVTAHVAGPRSGHVIDGYAEDPLFPPSRSENQISRGSMRRGAQWQKCLDNSYTTVGMPPCAGTVAIASSSALREIERDSRSRRGPRAVGNLPSMTFLGAPPETSTTRRLITAENDRTFPSGDPVRQNVRTRLPRRFDSPVGHHEDSAALRLEW